MKKLILVINDLGRVGKSSCALVLHEHLRRKGVENLHVTTDGAGAAIELHGDDTTDHLDLMDGVTPSDIIGLIDRAGVVIMDVHTDGGALLGEFFAEQEIATLLAELEAELTIVVPANDETEGFAGMLEIAEIFSDDADYVVVRTPVRADFPGDFENSEAAKALDYLGAISVDMPEVADGILEQLEKAGHDLAGGLANRKQLPRFLRNELHGWELDLCSALAAAEEFLLPAKGAASASPYHRQQGGKIGLAS